ncbi:hypothetical protein X777_12788 [Ooceraea biroi]|uniref:Uncharacterized protein n=1 Tax=Ooceraea biroi TaxID=2015173 RepID=A0A026W056_OOCBI|nr:hypothetical protein X777_12788 [Ooceraea biroi]
MHVKREECAGERGTTLEITKPLNYRLVPEPSWVDCNRERASESKYLVSIRGNMSETDAPKGFNVIDVSHNT